MPKKDDITNHADALLYLMPGGIEAAEARGQRELCHDETLPTEGLNSLLFEKLGGVLCGLADGDPLFTTVTLPAGWKKERTDHSMWSNLVDTKGRKRAAIFYKAAFYDRKAHMYFERYFHVRTCFYDAKGELVYDPKTGNPWKDNPPMEVAQTGYHVLDAHGRVHFSGPLYPQHDYSVSSEVQCAPVVAWLKENYPNADDYIAYWDEDPEPKA